MLPAETRTEERQTSHSLSEKRNQALIRANAAHPVLTWAYAGTAGTSAHTPPTPGKCDAHHTQRVLRGGPKGAAAAL